MDIHLFNAQGLIEDALDDYEEFEETSRYFSSSHAVIKARMASKTAEQIQRGKFFTPSDSLDVYRVEQIERETDEKGVATGHIIITAVVSGHLSERHIFPPDEESHDKASGPAEEVMKHYVNNHAGPNADPKRQVPLLAVEANANRGPSVSMAARFDNLADLLKRISILSGLGWRVKLNSSNEHEFTIIEGVDRSAEIYLDPEMDTVATQKMLSTELGKKTYGLVAGQGEGVERQIVNVWTEQEEPEGWLRREGFIDARDLPQEGEGEELDDATLRDRGRQKLEETKPIDLFEVDALAFGSAQFGVDFALGDIVTSRNQAWGLSKPVRIVGVKRKIAKSVYELSFELDQPWPSLKDKVNEAATGSPSGTGQIDYPNMTDYMPKSGGTFTGPVNVKSSLGADYLTGDHILHPSYGHQSSSTSLRAIPISNEFAYWTQRGSGRSVEARSWGISSDSGAAGLINPARSGGSAAMNFDVQEDDAWLEVDILGGSINSWSNAGSRRAYLRWRAGRQPSRIRVYFRFGSTWKLAYDDQDPTYHGGVWISGSDLRIDDESEWGSNGWRFRFDFASTGGGTSRVHSLGFTHVNIPFGMFAIPYLGENNTFFGDLDVEGAKNAVIADPEDETKQFKFAATESNTPGFMEVDLGVVTIPQNRQLTLRPDYLHKYSLIGRDPRVRLFSAGPREDAAPNAPYGWVEWEGEDPKIEVRGPSGDYYVEMRFIRNDPGVEGWEHYADASPEPDLEENLEEEL